MEFRTCRRHWGAEFISDDVVRFRVWAEGQKELTLRLAATDVPMTAVGHGWFQADVSGVTHGAEYQFVLQDGMTVPDPDLHFDEESGHYRFGEIDWQEFDEVINGRGICNHERLAAKRKAWDDGAWVREAALAHAEKQRARQAA